MQNDPNIRKIRAKNPSLADQIVQRGGFILDTMIGDLTTIDRMMLVMVRCGNGRFICPIQDVKHFVTIIEDSNEDTGDYVRDISIAHNVRTV